MPLWARKKDRTHNSIVETFEKCGFVVLQTYRAPHCPDLIVARPYYAQGTIRRQGTRVILVEVKSGKKQLTDEQRDRFAIWPGETAVVTSVDDVLRLVRAA